jgi:hypothetical protein
MATKVIHVETSSGKDTKLSNNSKGKHPNKVKWQYRTVAAAKPIKISAAIFVNTPPGNVLPLKPSNPKETAVYRVDPGVPVGTYITWKGSGGGIIIQN